MVLIKADHYTYGIYPDELGYSIKTWSDELWNSETAKLYERKFEYVEFSKVLKVGEARGLIKLRKNGREKIVLSLFKGGTRDKDDREGVYSHHISVNLDEYIKIGANPRLLEKYIIKDAKEYAKFVRDTKLKVKADPIRIEIDENSWRYKVEDNIENYIKSKNTLKNILAEFLKGEKLKLLCRGKDANTLIRVAYALLELLPPRQRVIQFSTLSVIKNESEFGLVLLTEGPFKREWRVIDIDKEIEFSQRDNIDKFIGHVIDRYFEKGSDALREDYTIWEKMEEESKDLEDCAKMFVQKVIMAKYTVENLLNRAKEDFKNNRFLDADLEAKEVISRIGEIPNNERKKQVFLDAGEIILRVADERKEGFNSSLKDVMTKAGSIFQKEQKIEIIMTFNEKVPNYRNEISSYLERVPTDEIFQYLPNCLSLVTSLSAERLIKHKDFTNSSFAIKMDIFHKYFEKVEPIKIINDLETDEYASTPMYKALITIFKNRHNIHDAKYRDTIELVITKIIDSFEEVIIKPLFGTPKLDAKVSLVAFSKLFSSNIIILLLCLIENLGLKDHAKKMKRILESSIDILFSPTTIKGLEFSLEK